jgi:hypothetical protein
VLIICDGLHTIIVMQHQDDDTDPSEGTSTYTAGQVNMHPHHLCTSRRNLCPRKHGNKGRPDTKPTQGCQFMVHALQPALNQHARFHTT